MALFYDYKHVSEEQFQELEEQLEPEVLKSKLFDVLGISYDDERKLKICMNYHFFNYVHCRENAYNARKSTTFLSIMKAVFVKDMESGQSMAASFEWFKNTLLKHCVERVPTSAKVFEESEVGPLIDFVTESYYRQYRLFQYIFGTQKRLQLRQVMPNEIEIPFAITPLQPLSAAVLLQPEA